VVGGRGRGGPARQSAPAPRARACGVWLRERPGGGWVGS
jgi:hypothetical protein